MTDRLRYRSAELVLTLLGLIYDDDDPDEDTGIPWNDVLEPFAAAGQKWSRRTIEATIYDLQAFGALHRSGRPPTGKMTDTRALHPTPLGRAWLAGELLPPPRPKTSDE